MRRQRATPRTKQWKIALRVAAARCVGKCARVSRTAFDVGQTTILSPSVQHFLELAQAHDRTVRADAHL